MWTSAADLRCKKPYQPLTFISTSIMSNIIDSGDTIDLCSPPQAEATPLPVNAYPLLGLALVLVSAVLTCTAAYYFLADW
jgi:hypothetical protein